MLRLHRPSCRFGQCLNSIVQRLYGLPQFLPLGGKFLRVLSIALLELRLVQLLLLELLLVEGILKELDLLDVSRSLGFELRLEGLELREKRRKLNGVDGWNLGFGLEFELVGSRIGFGEVDCVLEFALRGEVEVVSKVELGWRGEDDLTPNCELVFKMVFKMVFVIVFGFVDRIYPILFDSFTFIPVYFHLALHFPAIFVISSL